MRWTWKSLGWGAFAMAQYVSFVAAVTDGYYPWGCLMVPGMLCAVVNALLSARVPVDPAPTPGEPVTPDALRALLGDRGGRRVRFDGEGKFSEN